MSKPKELTREKILTRLRVWKYRILHSQTPTWIWYKDDEKALKTIRRLIKHGPEVKIQKHSKGFDLIGPEKAAFFGIDNIYRDGIIAVLREAGVKVKEADDE